MKCSLGISNFLEEISAAAAAAKSLKSCPTLYNPIDGSPPGSLVPGILQARTLEWLPFPSSMHESEKWKWSRSVVSDSLRLHGLQLTRLLCPWDFPGKSTGVGCHHLLRYLLLENDLKVTVHSDTKMVGDCSVLMRRRLSGKAKECLGGALLFPTSQHSPFLDMGTWRSILSKVDYYRASRPSVSQIAYVKLLLNLHYRDITINIITV